MTDFFKQSDQCPEGLDKNKLEDPHTETKDIDERLPEEEEQDNKEGELEKDQTEKQKELDYRKEIDRLKEALNQKCDANENLLDRLRRSHADFASYKKRVERNRFQDKIKAREDLIKDLLPVLDNMERAMEADSPACAGDAFVKGFELIYKQLLTILAGYGVQEISAQGEAFNPDYHEAVERVEDDNQPNDTIIEVMQKGYKMGDTVLRPSLVKVSKGGEDGE